MTGLGVSPIDLVGLARQVQDWIDLVLKRRKAEAEARAAQVLGATGILIAALHALDNSLRDVLAEFRVFQPDWPAERRERLIGRVGQFADDERILPVIRQYIVQLSGVLIDANPDDHPHAEIVMQLAAGVLKALGKSDVTPFRDVKELESFLDQARLAQTASDVSALRARSDAVRRTIAREVLARADEAFGKLKGGILGRHPELPDPGWAAGVALTR